MGKRIDIPKALLEKMLYEQHLSTNTIAQHLNVSCKTVISRMKEYGLSNRTEYNKEHITKELLEELYVDGDISIKNLAKQLGCGRDWMRERLIEYGFLIPRTDEREKPELTLEFFQREYYQDNISLDKIAKKYGFHRRTIRKAFRSLGLKTKKQMKCGDDVHSHQKNFHYAITNEEEIKELIEKGYLVSDLALYYECSQDTIYSTMKRFGLSFDFYKQIAEEDLRREYITEKKSMEHIASIYGCSSGTIRNRLIQYEIQIRDCDEIHKTSDDDIEKINELLSECYSYTAISDIIGCSMNTVRKVAIREGRDKEHYCSISTAEANMISLLQENDISYRLHDRKILSGQEIDIVIGDIGIEICPWATHNSDIDFFGNRPKDPEYHMLKRIRANEQGIELITKFDWMDEKETLYYLRMKLDLLKNVAKCNVRRLKRLDNEAKDFIKKNSYRYYDELIEYEKRDDAKNIVYRANVDSIPIGYICFSYGERNRAKIEFTVFDKTSSYDCRDVIRRFLDRFKMDFPNAKIYVEARCDISEHIMYEEMGFESVKGIAPKAYYVKNTGDAYFPVGEEMKMFIENENMLDTERSENMNEHNMYKVYDTGSILMKLL